MSTTADSLRPPIGRSIFESRPAEQQLPVIQERGLWDPDRFAEEQIRSLVRQVFFPGWPKPIRQVVFSAVEPMDIAGICLQVGQALAAQTAGSVCVVEANLRASELGNLSMRKGCEPVCGQKGFGSLRNSSRQISSKLWRVPINVFLGEGENILSPVWLGSRLRELRLEFDYTVLHGPPAGLCSEAALLGHLSDGIVLVLEANSTRRVAAQKVKQTLQATNARLLGTVLNQRTFPIPEGIYKKL